MIQIDRETFQMMLHQIMERFDRIDDRLNRMNRQTAALEGDKLLDNQDMCELLGVTTVSYTHLTLPTKRIV